jgi:damage-control phosphatase, subfamily I
VNPLKTRDLPIERHSAILESFLNLAEVKASDKKILKSELKRYIDSRILKGKWCHPMITQFHTEWYRELYTMVDSKDPYKRLKEKSNHEALRLLPLANPENFRDAIMLSIIGNKIDFGSCMNGTYDIKTLEADVANRGSETLAFDDTDLLQKRLQSARNVFYLFDNNGEMIFDSLLLEFILNFLPRDRIFLVGKESPMINDVTVSDLRKYRMDKYGTILSTGSNCFGLHEEEVSREFKDHFRHADMVIAKGQSFFEFFSEYNFRNVVHILRVKNDLIAPHGIRLERNQNVVMGSERYAGEGYDYKWD